MDTEKEKVSAVELRACGSCKFSDLIHMAPTDLRRVRICRRFPPQLFPVAGPQGVGLTCSMPIVEDSQWCYEYAPQGAANS